MTSASPYAILWETAEDSGDDISRNATDAGYKNNDIGDPLNGLSRLPIGDEETESE